jgi:hypothetical protein
MNPDYGVGFWLWTEVTKNLGRGGECCVGTLEWKDVGRCGEAVGDDGDGDGDDGDDEYC